LNLHTVLAFTAAVFAANAGGLAARGETIVLFDHFKPGWRATWREERLFSRRTNYEVAEDAGQPVLHATSRAANSGLLREVPCERPVTARLRWRWKVRGSLAANARERERGGDDYAARVFVVFETSVVPLRRRAIDYVWAAHEPAGAVFPNPYSSNVGMVVVRSGDAEAGRWQAESRDVLADYRRFFGAAPARISAVAVLVDTDNTGANAEAWFADLVIELESAMRQQERRE